MVLIERDFFSTFVDILAGRRPGKIYYLSGRRPGDGGVLYGERCGRDGLRGRNGKSKRLKE